MILQSSLQAVFLFASIDTLSASRGWANQLIFSKWFRDTTRLHYTIPTYRTFAPSYIMQTPNMPQRTLGTSSIIFNALLLSCHVHYMPVLPSALEFLGSFRPLAWDYGRISEQTPLQICPSGSITRAPEELMILRSNQLHCFMVTTCQCVR